MKKFVIESNVIKANPRRRCISMDESIFMKHYWCLTVFLKKTAQGKIGEFALVFWLLTFVRIGYVGRDVFQTESNILNGAFCENIAGELFASH